ncbi:MAG: rhodanese-like domain-containing protein [Spirochaetota bacterium]
MKKTLSLLAALIVALMLVGCGGDDSAPAETAEAEPEAQSAPEVDVPELAMSYLENIPPNKHIVPPAEVIDLLLAGEEPYILDLRRAEDYEAGHLRGAVNIPWGSSDIYEMMKYLPTDRVVYTYCYTGQTCGQYVTFLHLIGVDARTVNLGWNRALTKHESIDEVTETGTNPIDTSVENDIPAELYSAFVDYFEEMATRNGTPFANNIVAVDAAKAIFDAEDPDVMWIDQRRAEDHTAGHIPGSVSMPYDETFPDNVPLLPADKRLILYCYTGQGCGQTIAMLRLMGYDAFTLNSGMGTPGTMPVGWQNQGYPVASSD